MRFVAVIPLALYGLLPSSSQIPVPTKPIITERVFPATCVQRGQLGDRRRRHTHAGIDCAGERGSPIVASYAGVVLPAPGRDRGYEPRVIVIRGDDGICYRYAHLDSVSVEIGQRVATAEPIGTMGAVGQRGFPHLHFEAIPCVQYARKPYGYHSLDPNALLQGGRGMAMVAAESVRSIALASYASADLDPVVIDDAPRVRRHHGRRHHRHHRRHRHRA